ncbi:MAG: EAL domain-containing protein [Candidatus Dormibacteria bacterium]
MTVARVAAAARSSLVAQVAELASASRSLPRVLDRVVAALAEHGYPGAGISLINERDELYVVAYDGPADDDILSLRLPVGRGIMGSVAADNRSLLVADLDDPAGPAPANRSVGGHRRLRSLLAVPITVEGSVIGVLEVDGTEPGLFTEQDLALFEEVAASIASAVAEAAPYAHQSERLRQRVHELLTLEDTARALSASLEPADVQRAVVRSASLGLGAPVVVLAACENGTASVLAATEAARALGLEGRFASAALAEVSSRAPGTLCTLSEEDAAEPPLGLPAGALAGTLVTAIPVTASGEFAGVLAVCTPRTRPLDHAERGLLEGIADLAALALGNAMRYRRLSDAADTDALTGLPNRGVFERTVATLPGTDFAVIAIDIDRLKQTNDAYGHEAGDEVIRRVAATLRSLVPADVVVARTGADEFGLILRDADRLAAMALAEQARIAMHGLVVPFGVARISAGIATGSAGIDPRVVWSAAETALQHAKQRGRDGIAAMDPTASTPPHASQRWDEAVVELMASHGLEAVYQPIVCLDDFRVIAHEALARPLGAAPDLSVEGLFDAAQRARYTRELDWMARRSAVHDGRALPAGLPLFINCSVGALLDPVHDVDQMLLLLRWADRSPDEVVLEITEREIVDDLGRLRDVLATYRAAGFRFAIDDVGEGHSTLEVLAVAEPEFVKLARSMTVGAHLLGNRSAIRAVVAFARSSGAVIIAEGIEEERQAELVRAMDISHGQGWWLGRPSRLLQPRTSATAGAVLPLRKGA